MSLCVKSPVNPITDPASSTVTTSNFQQADVLKRYHMPIFVPYNTISVKGRGKYISKSGAIRYKFV
jgi:hypothetical protein